MSRKPTKELPLGWEWVRLGSHILEVKRPNINNDDLPVFSVTKNKGLILQSDKYRKRIASKDSSKYKVVIFGEFVYDPVIRY